MTVETKAEVTISSCTSNVQPYTFVRITIHTFDGVRISADLTPEQFGLALMARVTEAFRTKLG